MRPRYLLLYPEDGGAAERLFERTLSSLPPVRRERVLDAILRLEQDPRPSGPALRYWRTPGAEKVLSILRLLPGKPFRRLSEAYHDLLQARDHLSVAGVTVLYSIDEGRKVVWLMGIRPD